MVLSKLKTEEIEVENSDFTVTKRRRLRRNKLKAARIAAKSESHNKDYTNLNTESVVKASGNTILKLDEKQVPKAKNQDQDNVLLEKQFYNNLDNKTEKVEMSSKEIPSKTKEDVLAARQAKKSAKQKAKNKSDAEDKEKKDIALTDKGQKETPITKESTQKEKENVETPKEQDKADNFPCRDEVDRVAIKVDSIKLETGGKSKEQVIAERAAKKAAKQAKKKGPEEVTANQDMTVKDVVETLKDIKIVAKEVQDLTAKVSAIHFDAIKPEEGKSKAELKAERRAKQEAQRAAKIAADQKAAKPKPEAAKTKAELIAKLEQDVAKEKSPKQKSAEKSKSKSLSANRVNWFQHLHTEHDKESLNKIPINSNLHPAIVRLGVQLATRVVSGSNARCIALLDAIKKMVKDYSLPAKTEFARGLESHLAASLDYLWAMRQPSASQTNAVKYFRHHLTQLANNVDEFDAKKILQEEIDKYIEDQIDKAGEAISLAVRNKISTGDNILTYGCSSLIERILREAWEEKIQFRAVLVGNRVHGGAREMLRRLVACGLPCIYVDITAVSFIMKTINKVLLGASSLLVNGSVLGAAGTAQVAVVARAYNVPVLVACETHKFSERVQTDAFVYNEIGDPDELIDKSDENSPLKDWRTNPNLTPLNLIYDVTPPSLVTAVVTEKAILPCTSAPVVLRTKLSEYGM